MFDEKPQTAHRNDNVGENETGKRFRDASVPIAASNITSNNIAAKQNDVIINPNMQQKDIAELKSGINELKTVMQQVAQNLSMLNASNIDVKDALTKINETLVNLTGQVNDLKKRDVEKSHQICELDNRIQRLEQQNVNKNIEINNVAEEHLDAAAVVKTISASVGMNISDADIESAYRIKKNNKIIVEFSSLTKKRELMSKIKGHRIDANVLKGDRSDTSSNNNYIYVNDELTPHNRRLLWMAKTKAKECGWKFVWVRNGYIYARKNENSTHFIIKNTADIETISQSM